ncbi:MAG TPA: hypothetical protein DEF47_14030 [Herpetosiphon sp.]|uniref:Uncharacterized protein n=1 Tax=Herpetosiphon aurantiacus (strain ATCC 23779 / DSM 785 / 114-95) TaxID=316274 RepID=A9AZR1_HERA2|nr:hypothetical protein [Herpetosiphon sp.]ABX07115.1 hypothetical protein Haur_4483 [Herpetosiphon aurantiacus DSM 785]HBW51008.1 hypothetical protein [Herpetosiphon sp.]
MWFRLKHEYIASGLLYGLAPLLLYALFDSFWLGLGLGFWLVVGLIRWFTAIVWQPWIVWLSYGISFGLAVLIIALGLHPLTVMVYFLGWLAAGVLASMAFNRY